MYSILFWSLVVICITIVVLAKFNLIHKKYSYTALFIVSTLSFLLVWFNGFNFKLLGILAPTWNDIYDYSMITFLCCSIIWTLNRFWFKHKKNHNSTEVEIKKFLFYTIISVTVQEFLFRSFVYYSLIQMGMLNVYTMVILSFLLFGIAHLAFRGKIFKVGVFMMGIIWGVLYFYAPNLILISISHAVVGMFAYYQGL
ncbi:MAG TPA: CPBP family glutamic-type intramembrane protease, partial [Candidatus Dojkabacteria bacterium]|nr:CPBP family glutamic-type intramembrane protease [Candidatus Dojkabacteria bacterium]